MDQCVLVDFYAAFLAGAGYQTLSIAERQIAPIIINQGTVQDLNLRIPIDVHRIAEIERVRHGDADVAFLMKPVLSPLTRARFDLGNGASISHPVMLGQAETPEAKFTVSIPQSHWVKKILPKLSATDYLLLELPIGPRQLPKAWEYIDQAELAYLNRDFEGALVRCREAGDYLEGQLKDRLGIASFDYSERWMRTHKLFSHLASLGLHNEEIKAGKGPSASNVQIQKTDVENVLLFAKGVARFAELLIERVKFLPHHKG